MRSRKRGFRVSLFSTFLFVVRLIVPGFSGSSPKSTMLATPTKGKRARLRHQAPTTACLLQLRIAQLRNCCKTPSVPRLDASSATKGIGGSHDFFPWARLGARGQHKALVITCPELPTNA